MDPIIIPNGEIERTVRVLRYEIRRALDDMPGVAATVEMSTYHDAFIRNLVATLRVKLLAEELPPDRWTHTHPLAETVDDPRWATWWDHLKATYAQRWWARWWVARHPARTVGTQVTVRRLVNIPVELRGHWMYPHATIVPPELGYPVLKYDVNTGESAL